MYLSIVWSVFRIIMITSFALIISREFFRLKLLCVLCKCWVWEDNLRTKNMMKKLQGNSLLFFSLLPLFFFTESHWIHWNFRCSFHMKWKKYIHSKESWHLLFNEPAFWELLNVMKLKFTIFVEKKLQTLVESVLRTE